MVPTHRVFALDTGGPSPRCSHGQQGMRVNATLCEVVSCRVMGSLGDCVMIFESVCYRRNDELFTLSPRSP